MRDWNAFVRQQLETSLGERAEREETVSELASHLEDAYHALLAKGRPEEEAYASTCNLVEDWSQLSKEILAAKKEGTMENRVTQLWVPGIATVVAAAGLLISLDLLGVRPTVIPVGRPAVIVLHIPWLLGLPFIGAFGAFLAHRAHATRFAMRLSSLFPAIIMAIVMLSVFVGAFFLSRPVSVQMEAIGFWAAALNWVVLPTLALLLGDLAFHLLHRRTALS
jgi:hypothetical protein